MSRLPSVTPREVVAALRRAGFRERRQRESHFILSHPDHQVTVSIPIHKKEMPRGTLKAILKQAGLTDDAFLDLL